MGDYKIHKAGNLRGEKIAYKDGTGCCIWTPFKKDGGDEEPGLCFDCNADDLEDLRKLVHTLIEAKPDVFVEDPEFEENERKWKEKEKKLWYRIYDKLRDFSFCFTPFEWRFTSLLVDRPQNHGILLVFQLCEGFRFGPFTVTWPRYAFKRKQQK